MAENRRGWRGRICVCRVRRAAVIGCGVMGLTTARLLQDRGWNVTIYTKAMPLETTSSVAGGQWSPTSVFEEDAATAAFETQFKEAARIAHHNRRAISQWVLPDHAPEPPTGRGVRRSA